jgi:creatinine amidohydrolase
MLKCYRYGEMFPKDLKKILKELPVAYIPVSPLEWHGEHMTFACDALCAEEVVGRAWRKIGGVLHPTLHLGTDGTIHEKDDELWGMEMFAKERLQGSLFLPVDVFKSVIFHTLKFLERNGFKLAVIYTAHLSQQQIGVWKEIENEFRDSEMNVIAFHAGMVEFPEDSKGANSNHAGVEETSEILRINDKLVNLNDAGFKKCDKNVGLDRETLLNSTSEFGEKRLSYEVDVLVKMVCDKIKELV